MQHDFILLDRSGSMITRWDEALRGVNAYVEQLAKDKVDTGVTVAVFDTTPTGKLDFVVVRDRITPSTFKPVTKDDAEPRNGTPLSDAVGAIVGLARKGVPITGEQYEKVAIIIVTDGEENSSREYSVAQAKALLDDCRKDGWQVLFIGQDFQNSKQAMSFGNAANTTISSSSANMGATLRATASKRGIYGLTGQSMVYSDDEKKKAAEI